MCDLFDASKYFCILSKDRSLCLSVDLADFPQTFLAILQPSFVFMLIYFILNNYHLFELAGHRIRLSEGHTNIIIN
jgi:hypothetical protein